jgi:hypothetical protein
LPHYSFPIALLHFRWWWSCHSVANLPEEKKPSVDSHVCFDFIPFWPYLIRRLPLCCDWAVVGLVTTIRYEEPMPLLPLSFVMANTRLAEDFELLREGTHATSYLQAGGV